MSGINKVILIGNVGAVPEIRYTGDGRAVATVSLATSDKWKDKQTGQPCERTEWHRCVFFERKAELVQSWVQKGTKLFVEGANRTDKYTDHQGVERYTTVVRVRDFQVMAGGIDAQSAPQQPQQTRQNPNGSEKSPYAQTPQTQTFHPPAPPGADAFDDDIPS